MGRGIPDILGYKLAYWSLNFQDKTNQDIISNLFKRYIYKQTVKCQNAIFRMLATLFPKIM